MYKNTFETKKYEYIVWINKNIILKWNQIHIHRNEYSQKAINHNKQNKM